MRKARENGMGNLFHKFAGGASGRDRMKLCYCSTRSRPSSHQTDSYKGYLERITYAPSSHNARSYGRIFEVLPEEVENAELIAEEAVSHLLLGLFDEVIVDDVSIHFSCASRMGQRDCFIQIQAQCSLQSFKMFPCTREHMELTVGKS